MDNKTGCNPLSANICKVQQVYKNKKPLKVIIRMYINILKERELSVNSAVCIQQPLHSEISSAPTLLGLRSSNGGEPLMESMGDPVEELREAVEMLNDTVRERGRAQSHEQAVQELLSKVKRYRLHSVIQAIDIF